MKSTHAVAALGLAGLLGIAVCGVSVAASAAPQSPTAPVGNTSAARETASIAVGKSGLPALSSGVGQATLVYCDPSTVSHAPNVSRSTSARCGINYSDGSVWQQSITVIFDRHGHPVADSATQGTEILPPTAGLL